MKKIIFLISLTMAGLLRVSAQTSVGFSDNNSKPLWDYRLPDWGYKLTDLKLNLSGRHYGNNRPTSENKTSNLSWIVNPYYFIMRESETRNFYIGADGSFVNSKNEYYRFEKDDFKYKSDDETKSKYLDAKFESGYFYYINNFHVTFLPKFNYSYSKNSSKGFDVFYYTDDADTSKSSNKYTTTSYDISFASLYGIGRIRNVSPVVMAMRLRERLNTIGKSEAWTDETTQRVAEEFSKLSSYHAIYDRPEKEFWKSIDEAIPQLTPFESHYLNDVMDEAVGNRLEGYMVEVGPRIIHYYRREKEIVSYPWEDFNDKTKRRSTYMGLLLRGQVYHNYSLSGQIGLDIAASIDFRSGSKKHNPINTMKQMHIAGSHLYALADRLLWNVNAGFDKAFIQIGENDNHKTYKTQYTTFETNLTYFIENRVSLTGNFRWYKIKNTPSSEFYGPTDILSNRSILNYYTNTFPADIKSLKNWYYGIGLTYHFNRALL